MVKVSRKLQPETGARDNPGTVNLIEVKEMDLPNVRTNLPEFFTSKPSKRERRVVRHFNSVFSSLYWRAETGQPGLESRTGG